MSDPSLRGRVASDAASSARIRALRVRVLRAGAGEVLLDGLGPLGEPPQPPGVEPGHLPASVAVRAPLDTEPFGEAAAELLLVDGPGGLAPLVERAGVEGGVGAVRTDPQVRDHRERPQHRNRLRGRERHVKGRHRPLSMPAQERRTAPRVTAQEQCPQVVVPDHS